MNGMTETAVRDDRTATDKADTLANKVNNLQQRVRDMNARLGRSNDIREAVNATGTAPPRPQRLLHDALDEASATVDAINEALDKMGVLL